MKAITLHQPWASAMALRCKQVETRGWRTHYRGPIAIHASLAANPQAIAVLRGACAAHQTQFVAAGYESGGNVSLIKLPQSCIVAIGTLDNCEPVECLETDGWLIDPERHWGNYAPGRYGWTINNIRRLATPIRTRGFQGLWNWEPPGELKFIA